MTFIREQDQTGIAAKSLDGLKQAFRLNRERSRVVVGFAVNEEDRSFDFVSAREWRDFHVYLRCLPERPPFTLESERRQRSVVCTTSRNARRKEVTVS